MTKKITCLLLVTVLMLFAVVPAQASDQPTPRYAYITTLAGDISIDSSAVASCYGSVSTLNNLPVKVVVELQIYRGGEWVTEKTWIKTGTAVATIAEYYNLAYGNNYRVKVTGYVYDTNGNLLESATDYDSQYCPWPTRNVE